MFLKNKHFSKYYKITLFLFLSLLVVNNIVFSQVDLKSYILAGISVEGNQFSDTETILALSGLKVGSKVTIPYDDNINNAIKNLWQRKQFSDVEILTDKITSEGVFLTIKVKEFKRLSQIEINNNDKIKTDDIRKAIGKRRGDLISNYDIYMVRKDIKKLYDAEGLIFAKVETKVYDADTNTYLKLIIDIEEGSNFYVSKINFDGNTKLSQSELASGFEDTKTKSWYEFWKSSKFDKTKYSKDLENLKKYLKKKGYIDAELIKDSVIYNEEKKEVEINIKINEGNRVFVRHVNFQGNTVFTEEALARRLEFKSGDPYDAEKFEQNLSGNQDQTDAAGLYNNNGYLMCRLEKEIKRISPDTIDILVNVYENDRFKIRKVDIIGNTKTKDKVIRRELYTYPGAYFDKSAIINSVKALGMLNYFNQEGLKPDVKPVPGDNTSVDVLYKVEEKSTDTFNASIGFAGTFGLTGAIGFTFNNFAFDEPFKGGGGEIFNFNWEFGQASRYRSFNIGYTQPWLNDKPTTLGGSIYDTYINYGYVQERKGIQLNWGKRLKLPDNYFRVDANTRIQLNDVGASTVTTLYKPGKYMEVAIGGSISRTNTNSPFFPSTGSKFSLSGNFAMGALGIGKVDFLKTEMHYDFYAPLMKIGDEEKLVFYLGSRVGYITGFKTDTTLSPIELYRMGGNGLAGYGITPLRGYADNAIEASGGKVLSKYTAELRFQISSNPMPIYLYGFAEAGNVWDALKDTDPFDLKRSAGLGIQLFMNPIGIIGFSYGYGFDTPKGAIEPSGWKFLFHLGQQF